MRILLLAYEFPPSPSPQSLRWAYLARELAMSGHEVHVLTIDLGGSTPGLPALPAGVHVHRTHAGPVRGLLAARRNRRERDGVAPASPAAPASRGGWTQRAWMLLQDVGARVWFPDLRGEWQRPAARALLPLLDRVAPDVVVSSHEPATTLELGLEASRRGLPWVADIGDPVLAPYTPARWRRRAARLEAEVCARADRILVTTATAAALMQARHGRSQGVHVITQGFDDRLPGAAPMERGPGVLDVLYTGSFYAFRRAGVLVDAVMRTPGVRLSIAAVTLPDDVLRAAARAPDRIRLLGFLPHTGALARQRAADVLVSIANRDPCQVPGKVYEYFGAGRPILHVHHGEDDAVSRLLAERRRGVGCHDDADAIAGALGSLARAKQDGRLEEGFDLSPGAVADYGWSHLAGRLEAVLAAAAGR